MSGKKFDIDKTLLTDINPTSWVIPAEMPVKTKKARKTLVIGVPKESFFQENRVPLTPEAVSVLTANGHSVYVQKGAGLASSFTDNAYSSAGAFIAYSLEDIYSKCEVIVKISPLSKDELDMLRHNQILISAVNLGSLSPESLQVLTKKSITAIGFEFLRSPDGGLPLVQLMSEIAGVTSIHVASELLSGFKGGRGVLLGGITGVPPTVVTIIGAGSVGLHAARTALGVGATVRVIDDEISRLRELEIRLGQKVHTAVSLHNYVEEAVLSSDVVIGAAFKAGYRTPLVVTEEMVAGMKEGSVIVDVSIDQGGCVATSRPTTHENPTFTQYDVIHYCVPNIPSRVPNTASCAISNILGPLLIQLGDHGGMDGLIRWNDGVREGVYVYRKHITKQSLSSLFGMDSMDINLLLASSL